MFYLFYISVIKLLNFFTFSKKLSAACPSTPEGGTFSNAMIPYYMKSNAKVMLSLKNSGDITFVMLPDYFILRALHL
jgi:hypothetical protein